MTSVEAPRRWRVRRPHAIFASRKRPWRTGWPPGEAAEEKPVSSTTGPFQLRTFGRLALIDAAGAEGPSLSTRPRKLAVLAWLALRPGRRATRDRLIGVF